MTPLSPARIALITGAGRGIGRAIARALAQQGYHLALSARRRAGLEETAALVHDAGGTTDLFPADLCEPDAAARLIGDVVATCGGLDVLVNNAGQLLVKPFAETTLEEFDRLLAVNLRAPFALTKTALPHLAERHGAVINIASSAGKRYYANQSAYCATKHGLLGLNKVLAKELRAHGVRVHAVCPGGVYTEMTTQHQANWREEDLMSPHDVAAAVVYLLALSPRATVDELPMRRVPAEPVWG